MTLKKIILGVIWGLIIGLAGLIVLVLVAQKAHGQFRETPPAAVYLVTQPTDLGIGVRGDYHVNHWAGLYGSASYGQWRYYGWSGLDQHFKSTLGLLIPYKDWMGNHHDFSVGLNYHWVSGEVEPDEIYKDADIFHQPLSFELGLTIKYPRFALAFRTDILRWEPCIDIGIPIRSRYKKKVKYKMIKPEPTIKRKNESNR